MKKTITYFVFLLMILPGCQQSETAAPATESRALIMQSPIVAERVELPPEAIPAWRRTAAEKPAIVILSQTPMLDDIPPQKTAEAIALVRQGTLQELRAHGSINRADPHLLPGQTLSAALEAGLFSAVYWVLPTSIPNAALKEVFFREQLNKNGIKLEKPSLTGGIYSGLRNGVPFHAVHPQALKEITAPHVLHLDLSYLLELSAQENKIPLYNLLFETALGLKNSSWQPLTTTLSYSTLEGVVPLDLRFLLSNLAELLQNPQLLQADMPSSWALRNEALQTGDVFSKTKLVEIADTTARAHPQDPDARFDLFKALFLNKNLPLALTTLDQTVDLDQGYAAAYIMLAQLALQDNNTEAAINLLTKSRTYFPDNPFIVQQLAQVQAQTGRTDEALKLLGDLKKMQWSSVYHSEVAGKLEEMIDRIAAGSEEKPAGETR